MKISKPLWGGASIVIMLVIWQSLQVIEWPGKTIIVANGSSREKYICNDDKKPIDVGSCGIIGDEISPARQARQGDVVFRVERVDPTKPDGRFQIIFENNPGFIHSLQMNPHSREATLKRGKWLILVWNVASQTDKNCISTAIGVVMQCSGKIQLGVRPFRYYEEMTKWLPEDRYDVGSPLWVIVKDGDIQKWNVGPLDESELITFIESSLGDAHGMKR